MTTGIIGSQEFYPGNILLGGVSSTVSGHVDIEVLVLDSISLLVRFSDTMSVGAIDRSAYSLFAVSDPAFTHLPPVGSVVFNDASKTEVVLTFSESLTFGQTYSLATASILNETGDASAGVSYNFVATVPDPPRALGAYVSGLGQIDVVYDRPVAPYTTGTGAIPQIKSNGNFHNLNRISYSPGLFPVNNLRFQIVSVDSDSSFDINPGVAIDVSGNNSDPSLLSISLPFRGSSPYTSGNWVQTQIVDSFVSHVSTDYLKRGFIKVYFNCPLFESDAINTSNWSVNQLGSHLIDNSSDQVVDPDPTNLTNLISFSLSMQSCFNSHVVYPGVHAGDVSALPSESDLILLCNSLLSSLRRHIQQHSTTPPSVHLSTDTIGIFNLSDLKNARNLNEAISILNTLKSVYNNHLVSIGVHSSNDLYYTVTSPNAFDLRSAIYLSDELRSKIQMHVTSPYFHGLVDTASVPDVGYIYQLSTYPTPSDLFSVTGLITELTDKYIKHIQNTNIHTYEDQVNVVNPIQIGITENEYLGGFATRPINASVILRDAFNSHLNPTYPTTIYSVTSYASDDKTDVSDKYSYPCILEVGSNSPFIKYTVTTTVRSSDLSSQTNPGNFTGSISPRSLSDPPTILSYASLPDGGLRLRFDREVTSENLNEYQVITYDGSQQTINSVRSFSSVHVMTLLLNDILTAYSIHIQSSGHKTIDTINSTSLSDRPDGSLLSLILKLNSFKNKLNHHSSDKTFHQDSSVFPVLLSDAFDLESAHLLIMSIGKAFLDHNSNLYLHTSLSPSIVSAPLSDEILIQMSGAMDGASYAASIPVSDNIVNRGGVAPHHNDVFTIPFRGVSQKPVLASAYPISGLQVFSDGTIFLRSDTVRFNFSRPMRTTYATNINLVTSGSVQIGRTSWVNDRVLSCEVSNMDTNKHYFSAVGFYDSSGNPVISNPGNGPYALPLTDKFIEIGPTGPNTDHTSSFDETPSFFGPNSFGQVYSLNNPTPQWVLLRFSTSSLDSITLSLFNDSGSLLNTQQVSNASSGQIFIPSLPSGDYFLEISTDTINMSYELAAYHDCNPNIGSVPTGIFSSAIGDGCANVAAPGLQEVYPSFVGNGSPVIITVNCAVSVSIWVYHNSAILGTHILTGSGIGSVVLGPLSTVLGDNYIVEISPQVLGAGSLFSIQVS